MLSKIKIKTILFLLIVMISIFSFYGLIYGLIVWNDAVSNLQQIRPEKRNAVSKEELLIEKGSAVRSDVLKVYLLFSMEEKDPNTWIREKIKQGAIEIESNTVFINENVKIQKIEKNNCEKVYCIQIIKPFRNIPSLLWRGLIGIEDSRFLEHQGVDYISILRALWVDLIHMKFVQGGSTITQQLIKNKYFTNEKSIMRKLHEAIYAVVLEAFISKPDILALYLNEMFWGSFQGVRIKGVIAASRVYFYKKAEDLSSYEMAILIAMLKGPNYYHPLRHTERLKVRANIVHKKLVNMKLIAQWEKPWTSDDWKRWRATLEKRSKKKDMRAVERFTKEERLEGKFERFHLFYVGEQFLAKFKDEYKNGDPALKVLIKDLKKSEARMVYYSKYERSQEKALASEAQQVGSVLKPLFYHVLLKDDEYQFDELVSTAPITLKLKSGPWSPAGKNLGPISLRYALEKSQNIPLVRLVQEYGFDRFEREIVDQIPHMKSPLAEYPSQLLGAVELTVEELARVYSKFIEKVCSDLREDNKIENTVLGILSDPSRTTLSKVVGKRLENYRFFGKTGTTDKGQDNWFVAFDGRYLYLIWFGNEGKREDVEWKAFGASTAFKVFQEFWLYRGRRLAEFSCL